MKPFLGHHDRCPCCNANLRYVMGGDPTETLRNATREVVVPERGPDPLYRECPRCAARWHRYAEGHPRRVDAEAYVSAWPAHGYRRAAAAWAEGIPRVAVNPGDDSDGLDWVQPAPPRWEPAQPPAAVPFDATLYVLTAWNPHGRPRPLVVNRRHHDDLATAVGHTGWRTLPAAVRDPLWRWAERSVAVLDAPEADVLEMARAFGQPALYRWTPGWLDVLAADGGDRISYSHPVTAEAADVDVCPMRAVRGAAQEPHVCRNPGGPWTSGAIHEAARWGHCRATMLEALGCAVCDGGPADGPAGRAISLRPQLVPSRYGPARYG